VTSDYQRRWCPRWRGLIIGLLAYQRAKREQIDRIALGMVTRLEKRITEVEAAAAARIDAVEHAAAQDRQICDSKLEVADHKMSVLRHERGNVVNSLDGLLLAIRFAPRERISEIVEIVQQQRVKRSSRKGGARNAAQIELSADRIIPNLDQVEAPPPEGNLATGLLLMPCGCEIARHPNTCMPTVKPDCTEQRSPRPLLRTEIT
jgi:hypothetical protein